MMVKREKVVSSVTCSPAPLQRVCSRPELVGRIYFDHYEPGVRDNERRAINEQPVRGGPLTASSGDSRA